MNKAKNLNDQVKDIAGVINLNIFKLQYTFHAVQHRPGKMTVQYYFYWPVTKITRN